MTRLLARPLRRAARDIHKGDSVVIAHRDHLVLAATTITRHQRLLLVRALGGASGTIVVDLDTLIEVCE